VPKRESDYLGQPVNFPRNFKLKEEGGNRIDKQGSFSFHLPHQHTPTRRDQRESSYTISKVAARKRENSIPSDIKGKLAHTRSAAFFFEDINLSLFAVHVVVPYIEKGRKNIFGLVCQYGAVFK
jgi:hypothetical protein